MAAGTTGSGRKFIGKIIEDICYNNAKEYFNFPSLVQNKIKENLRNGIVSYGIWICFHDPNLVEFYGHLGFDFVIIDGEHEAVEREKTQELIREVLVNLYSATPDGYCGDEDNGQTSAWYVFSALGFYPVTPGTDQYVIGSPLFDKATLSLENGNTFTITSENNSASNYYIQATRLNRKKYAHNYIGFDDIQNGGEFIFNLADKPNKSWGSKLENAPFSLSRK